MFKHLGFWIAGLGFRAQLALELRLSFSFCSSANSVSNLVCVFLVSSLYSRFAFISMMTFFSDKTCAASTAKSKTYVLYASASAWISYL